MKLYPGKLITAEMFEKECDGPSYLTDKIRQEWPNGFRLRRKTLLQIYDFEEAQATPESPPTFLGEIAESFLTPEQRRVYVSLTKYSDYDRYVVSHPDQLWRAIRGEAQAGKEMAP